MTGILTLLVIVAISLLVTRIATISLVHTGLSRESARFQSRSAFSGVGFTTSESETIVGHPVRRRIVMLLMLLGNTTIVTVMASLILGFVATGSSLPLPYRLLILVSGLVVLWLLASSKLVDRWLSRRVTWALKKWTDLEVRDYASLLHLADNHQILELNVKANDWLAGKTLIELALADEGVMIIGIRRSDGSYVGAPHGVTRVDADDLLILYGRDSILQDLDRRRTGMTGDNAHREAVKEQTIILRRQVIDETTRTTRPESSSAEKD